MTFVLKEVRATGPHVEAASIIFGPVNTLILGPSDTGKSYIFDCVSYCLGSSTKPGEIPQARGYERVLLEIADAQGNAYTIVRGLAGGSDAIFQAKMDEIGSAPQLGIDCNTLIKKLVGVEDRKVLKKAGVKGSVTAGDIRHWTLLSQTDIVAKDSVLGDTNGRVEREATLSLLLTGTDDGAIEVGASKDEKKVASGGVEAIENVLDALKAGLPDDMTMVEVRDALARVDGTLNSMSRQQDSRSQDLKQLRQAISECGKRVREAEVQTAQSVGLVRRFHLLSEKYDSDLDRLVAMNEGLAVYRVLDEVPCPLCGTPIEAQVDPALFDEQASLRQQQAFAAEADKIQKLRTGLITALTHEEARLVKLRSTLSELDKEQEQYERQERQKIEAGIDEFAFSPKDLATRRSELFSYLQSFEEIERLIAEQARLKEIASSKRAKIERATAQDGISLSGYVLALLNQWGFADIRVIRFDAQLSDIEINNRKRTSFGQGARAVFLAAYYIGLMEHCLTHNRPHPGILVIDCPLKSYADRKQVDADDPKATLETVRGRFYEWLSKRAGPGQLVVLENEEPPESLAALLNPIELTGLVDMGRAGFYPSQQVPGSSTTSAEA